MPEGHSRDKLTYRDAGVDIDAADKALDRIGKLAQKTYGPHVLSGLGGFGGLFSLDGSIGLLGKHYDDPVLVACTDGVGTKLKVAFATNRHGTVGIDLVAMNVNDLLAMGADPLFFLDYFATGKLEPEVIVEVIEGIVEGCRQSGMALLGGETAEMPDMYAPGEYDLAGFCVGVMERRKSFERDKIEPGDLLVGIASSGLHSNGFSLARKALLEAGGRSLDEPVPELGCNLGEAMLRPTRIYAKAVTAVLKRYTVKEVVKGIAHITGGGLIDNLPRVLPSRVDAVVEKAALNPDPIFGMIQGSGGIDEEEMYHVFNMGIGMVMVCSSYYAKAIARTLNTKKVGEKASIIGKIEEGTGQVRLV
ncbi:MAG: phosphoribosylformylglycinamidine cyclo-ligase [Planctomycetes bacterium]|nr:phosphoribosylformylglycinamidine cyclo-ligase [Planctomycetota bacterium]